MLPMLRWVRVVEVRRFLKIALHWCVVRSVSEMSALRRRFMASARRVSGVVERLTQTRLRSLSLQPSVMEVRMEVHCSGFNPVSERSTRGTWVTVLARVGQIQVLNALKPRDVKNWHYPHAPDFCLIDGSLQPEVRAAHQGIKVFRHECHTT